MAGQIKRIIDTIIEQRAHGNPTLISTTRTKLILKGLNPSKFTPTSPDDPAILAKLSQVAQEMGVDPRGF
jgi:hypothetical protein